MKNSKMKTTHSFFILYIILALAGSLIGLMNIALSQDIVSINEKDKTFGTEFVFSIPPIPTTTNTQVILTIVSYSYSSVKITARYGFMQTLHLSPFEKVSVVLPAHSAFPYLKFERDSPVADAVYDAALRIVSDEAISVTATITNNKNAEGFVVLPIEVLGTKYIISSYNDATKYISENQNNITSLPSIITITAAFDATVVKFKLGGNAETSTAGGIKLYEEITKILNSGEVWVISTREQNGDLSGSTINSNMPVSVVSGNQCANVPIDNSPCNYLVEMEIPTNVFGKKFVVPALPNRKYNSVLRIFPAQDSTEIYIGGTETPLIIPKSGGTIYNGFLELRPNYNNNPAHTIISSNKPISITFYNTGSDEDSLYKKNNSDDDNFDESGCCGNAPFQMLLTPQEQLLNKYIFSIPEQKGEKIFNKNILCLIFETTSIDDTTLTADMNFEVFNGVSWQNGINDFEKIVSTSTVPYTLNNKYYAVSFYDIKTLSACQISADKKFALYIFGQSDLTSATAGAYGAMVGSGLLDITSGDTLAPNPTWEILCNGDVIGKVSDRPDESTHCSNLTLPIFYSQLSYNYDKQFGNIIPGITKEIDWNLFVRNKNSDAQAVIKFSDRAGNDTTVTIQYFAPKISLRPEQVNFNNIKFGSSAEKTVSITNESLAKFNIIKYIFKQYPQIFKLVNPYFGEIATNEEKIFKIEVLSNNQDVAKKHIQDTLCIIDSCGLQKNIIIEANFEQPEILAEDINFNECLVNITNYQKCKVTNRGNCDLIIYNFTPPKSKIFTVNFPQPVEFPLNLKAGSSLYFNIGFKPERANYYADSIIFHSDAIGPDSITYVSGLGVAPGLVAESYSWEKVRAYRKNFPTQPVPVQNEVNGLRIWNKSNFEIEIKDVFITDTSNSQTGFIIDDIVINSLRGKIIAPSEKVILPIDFFPMETKDYDININYISSNGTTSSSALYGKGVLPKYSIFYKNFDTLLLNDFSNSQTRTITIQNLRNNYNNDTLSIFNISSPDKSVLNGIYSNNGFKISLSENIFPVKIPPGESFHFDCNFVPTKIGENFGSLIFVTDAIEDTTIKILGYGAGKNILSQSTGLTVCQGEKGIVKCTIKNNGTYDLKLDDFYIYPALSVFSLLNIPKDTIVVPGNAIVIDVLFSPQSIGNYGTFLYFKVSGANYQFIDSIKIMANSYVATCVVDLKLSSNKISIGKPVTATIGLKNGEILKDLNIDKFNINIRYNADIIIPNVANIQIGSSISGKFFIEKYDLDNKNKNLIVYLQSIAGDILSSAGELLLVPFETYFPLENSNIVDVSASMISPSACATFIPGLSSAELSGICALDLRRVKLSPTSYYLGSVNPSPVHNNSNTIKINFGIGLEHAGITKLYIYSSNGELIATPVNKSLEMGAYELELDIRTLNSGMYYFSIISGPFSKTEKFVLIK